VAEAGAIHVAGTGCWVPPRVLGNAEVAALAGVTEEWILRRTGIRERRVAADGQGAAAMSAPAARAALDAAGIPAESLSVVIVATTTPDHLTPPTACELQAELGAWGAACLDVEAGFAGWIYALVLADSLLRAGRGEAALVVGVEKLSTVTDRADPSTGPLFGDGAGAVVLARGAGSRAVRSTSWWADGRLADALQRPAGGALRPFDARVLEERSHLLRMEGTKLFKAAVRTMAQQARAALDGAGLGMEDVGLIVPHQANLRIIEGLIREMELDPSRVYVNIDRLGNTGAATIPIALDEAVRAGRAPEGVPILLVSFGAGATAGAAVLG
jgi:3-oxoacyl-[acyl-carrier-protein] synthase III